MRVLSVAHLSCVAAIATLAACAGSNPPTTQSSPVAQAGGTPQVDARSRLKAGLMDAGEATFGLKVTAKAVPPQGFVGQTNSDLTFVGKYAIQGNYNGPVIWDMSNPSNPVLVTAYQCPASQNDVSVYKNLMFMSAEAYNGRIDCKPSGAFNPADSVSKDRMRGVRVFDITDIRNPKLVANVQTCRGSHTHTVLEDPKDKDNVYIYVSGSAPIRSPNELAGCLADTTRSNQSTSLMRIEIIKVPLARPEQAAVVNRANIFSDLKTPPSHGASEADKMAQKRAVDSVRARGTGFIAVNPQTKLEFVVNPFFIRSMLDSIVRSRGGAVAAQNAPSTATAADTAALRASLQSIVNRTFAPNPNAAVPGVTAISPFRQCHDITVYPALGLAGGACEGHGFLLDISNPIAPVRLDAVADSNFAYWHSATFNNDGTKILFSDEWGGGGAAKCRAGDPKEFGSNAIFTIENRKLKFQSYYKLPSIQSDKENCVAHNGSLIPIPGRDVMIQAWYQGGISVFDFTDPKNPREIAYFDRGPIDSTRFSSGGSWSAYWYNGQVISSEIARGMDVAELVPTQYVSQNEIDAAKTVHWDQFNAQGQPKIVWPPSFALAKAFVDQLERNKCLSDTRVASVRQDIGQAERTSGTARRDALTRVVSSLEQDKRSSCDAPRVGLLQKALNDLSGIPVP
jgi:hypothetical protein